MADLTMKRGDKLPRATATLTDADGTPIDLTTATIRFRMRAIRGTELLVDDDAEKDDATNGVVGYTWKGTDTDLPGGFDGEFSATFPGGRETMPNTKHIAIAIIDDLRDDVGQVGVVLLAPPALFAEDRGVDYDPTDRKALRALERASALFRSLAAQTISRVEDDVVELRGAPTRDLYLPERPVVSVKNVTIRDDGLAFVVPASTFDLRPRGLLRQITGGDWGGYQAAVALTYTHGYEVIPDDVVEAVLSIAGRKLGEQIATPDQVGEAGLTADELRVIRRYQP